MERVRSRLAPSIRIRPAGSRPNTPTLRSIIHNLCAERSCNEHDFSPAKDDRDDDDNKIIVRGGGGNGCKQFDSVDAYCWRRTHTWTRRRKDLMESIEILRNKLERGGGGGVWFSVV